MNQSATRRLTVNQIQIGKPPVPGILPSRDKPPARPKRPPRGVGIGIRLALAFGVVLALCSVLGVFSIAQLQTLHEASSDISHKWMVGARLVSEMNTEASNFRIAEAQHILSGDPADKTKYAEVASAITVLMADYETRYAPLIGSPAEKKLWDEFKRERRRYLDEHLKLVRISNDGQEEDAKMLLRYNSQQKYDRAALALKRLVDFNVAGGKAAARANGQTFITARGWIIGAMVLAVMTGTFLAIFITRSITFPIRAAVRVAETVARGDLGSRIEQGGTDETGQLLRALGGMNDNLASLVGKVRGGADAIASASAQIASGNQDLSNRTEQQAAALQQTAASMEELSQAVMRNARDAVQANDLAGSASELATRGGAVVAEVIHTMAAIALASRRISDIVGVIDTIAFQTNILALNAAVEAARAGDQGRGFAVVAAEVRTLAHRSASAAKQIKVLIDDAAGRVSAGTALADQAGAEMRDIVAGVVGLRTIMGNIATASRIQGAGIDQVNQEISAMDDTTQRNAALVEQAAAAAQSLQDQAEELAGTVSLFRILAH